MLRGCPKDRVSSGGGSALSVPGWNHSQSSGCAGWLRWFSLLSRDLTRDPSPVKPTSCSLYGTQKEMSCFSCGLSQTYLALGSHYECFHVLLPVIKRKKNVIKKSWKGNQTIKKWQHLAEEHVHTALHRALKLTAAVRGEHWGSTCFIEQVTPTAWGISCYPCSHRRLPGLPLMLAALTRVQAEVCLFEVVVGGDPQRSLNWNALTAFMRTDEQN